MARINDLERYPIKNTCVQGENYVIGTCGETGLTMNFKVEDCDPDGTTPDVETESSFQYFQFQNDLISDINNTNLLTESFLQANGVSFTQTEALDGITINLTNVGRYGFVIEDSLENSFSILDALNLDVTSTTFDTLYDSVNSITYFVSKEYSAPNNIFFKFVTQ